MFSFCSVHFFPQKPSFQTNHGTTDMIHSCSCQSVYETLDLKFLQMVRPVPHIISRRHWCVTVCVNGWMRGKICKAPQNNKCSTFIWEVKLKMLGGKNPWIYIRLCQKMVIGPFVVATVPSSHWLLVVWPVSIHQPGAILNIFLLCQLQFSFCLEE